MDKNITDNLNQVYENISIDTVSPEGTIIALLLKKPTAIYDMTINKTYFNNKDGENQNRAIFAMMEYLAETKDVDKLAFDPVTVSELAYKDTAIRSVLNSVFKSKSETIKYLSALKEYEVDIKNLDIYEEELKKAKMTNDLLEKNKETVKEVVDNYNDYEAEGIVDKVEDSVLQVSNDFIDSNRRTEHIFENFEDEYLNAEPNEKGFKGMSSPFTGLDRFTNGILRENSLTVFAALSGVGKSVILKQIVKHVGIDLGHPVLWIGTEQPKTEQRDRLISEISGLHIKIIENKLFNMPDKFDGSNLGLPRKSKPYDPKKLKERVKYAGQVLKKSDIFIDKMEAATPESILRKSKFYKKRYGIKSVIFDYIDDSYGRNGEELRHFLTRIATIMKQEIADKLNIPVISAAQSHDYEPWHTRESKGIEKKCSTLVWLKELSKKEKKKESLGSTHGFVLPKNRNGKKHTDVKNQWLPLKMNKKTLKFNEIGN